MASGAARVGRLGTTRTGAGSDLKSALGGDGVLTTKITPWYGSVSADARMAARVGPAVRPVRGADTARRRDGTRAADSEAHQGMDA
jgi:hypothetical protein